VKILFVTNIPSPYRVDFFNELGKVHDLKVVFEAEKAPIINNKWCSNNSINNFDAVFLKDGEIEERKINWRILKQIKRSQHDIVVLTNYAYLTEMLALIYLKIRSISYCLEVDGGIIKKENLFKRFYKSFLIKGACGYISPSKQTDGYLIHYGVEQSKIYRYPFTSLREQDILVKLVSEDEKLKLRKKLGIKERKMVLIVGQFIHRKGFDILLNAAKHLQEDPAIVFVGGEPSQEYIDVKNKYDLQNVYFLGFKLKEELVEYYKAADLFVLPTREDIWGLVINEALAYGLPVITTDKCVAGLELVEDGLNGYIVPTENDTELAKRMTEILNDENLRIRMGQNSLMKISEYTIENMAKKHFEIFNHIKKCI
jgi:glycosyltransferase involved in cell wall biosynthesis